MNTEVSEAGISEWEQGTETGENDYTRGKSAKQPDKEDDKKSSADIDMLYFQQCYKYRHELHNLVDKLLSMARLGWQSIVKPPNVRRYPGIITREKVPPPVEKLDRTRIVALIEGCDDPTTEFLDKELVRRLFWDHEGGKGRDEFGRPKVKPFYTKDQQTIHRVTNIDEAEIIINQSYFAECATDPEWAPTPGPINMINDLLQNKMLFIEEDYAGVYSLDRFFSELLYWDDEHCYGLYHHLWSTKEHTDDKHLWTGKGYVDNKRYDKLPYLFQAARKWLSSHKSAVIYNRYPHSEEVDNRDHSNYD